MVILLSVMDDGTPQCDDNKIVLSGGIKAIHHLLDADGDCCTTVSIIAGTTMIITF